MLNHSPLQLVYLHGVPGGPSELQLCGLQQPQLVRIFRPDRLTTVRAGSQAEAQDALRVILQEQFPNVRLHLVGFSLGSRAALSLAARMPDTIAKVDLVSPAAPLELGNFLPNMAGRVVFELARDNPRGFVLLTSIQSIAARFLPRLLRKMIFHGVRGREADLLRDPGFCRVATNVLSSAYVQGLVGLRREISEFSDTWSDCLGAIRAPVRLWHGTADTWAPFSMSEAIKSQLTSPTELIRLEGYGHYSTLIEALPRILQDAGPQT